MKSSVFKAVLSSSLTSFTTRLFLYSTLAFNPAEKL